MRMFPFLYLQVKYKETIGQGTPIPDLPEVKRVKETQKHISSVIAHMFSMQLCNQHPCHCCLAPSRPCYLYQGLPVP